MTGQAGLRRLGSVLWLLLVWFALWRDISWANLVSWQVVATLATLVFAPAVDRPALRVRPLALVYFVAMVAWSIVRANFVVAWEVLTPTNRTKEGVVAVDLESSDPLVILVVSHAIGLAPGTMVVDVQDDPTVLFVHVLHLDDVEDVRAEVLRLEQLALRALRDRSPDAAVAT